VRAGGVGVVGGIVAIPRGGLAVRLTIYRESGGVAAYKEEAAHLGDACRNVDLGQAVAICEHTVS
jgi:hypothetical protein